MSISVVFPLPLLPTVPGDLDVLDSRLAIRYMNSFMKNTLIRGMNNLYELAALVEVKQRSFVGFVDYALVVCDMLLTHAAGDEMFFTSPIPSCKNLTLVGVLGADCNLNDSQTFNNALKPLQQSLKSWRGAPNAYSVKALRSALERLAKIILPKMKKQVDAMSYNVLKNHVSDKVLRDMIQSNLEWLASHSDITYLLPFVLSHHDPRTSAHWPAIAPEGLEAIPGLVQIHSECWRFAPIDPKTRKARPKHVNLSG